MVQGAEEGEGVDKQTEGSAFLKTAFEKMKRLLNSDEGDEETTMMVERLAILRISTKHVNIWIRQLEMKRKEMSELAGLMKLEEIKKEIVKEKSLERWARRCTNHFTKKVKRVLFEETDNMVWSGRERDIILVRAKQGLR